MTEGAGVGGASESSAETAEPAVIILSGLSGGGKTAAAKLFEDLGYTVIDNLPGELLSDLAELVSSDRTRFAQVAIVMDVRAGDTMLALAAMRGALEGRGIRPRIVFLEARDEILIRRYSETRHAHPLGDQHGIASSIAAERSLLEPIRQEADIVIDTSDLSLRELRERLFTQLGTITDPDQLAIQLISFGFKYGLPLEADLVFDVRFMQNPYYVAELRQSSGLTEAVKTYVLGQPVAERFLDFVESFLEFALPAYVSEGKSRLTIAIGCTGGYHRSIVIAEELATWLREREFGPVAVFHRELDRDVNLRRWLTPGIGVKRWLLVVFFGLLLLALAFAHMLRQATRDLAPGGPLGTIIDTLTLQFLPYPVRGLIVAGIGVGILLFGAVQLGRALTDPFRSDEAGQPLVELIYQKRFLARGPRIVAIGGGTGLSALLRGLKEHTSNLTAVVTVADDGGSSGVLRESLGIPPVGDIRNCIAALADAEPLMNELLQYRFPETAEGEAPGLGGHAVGNLLLAAMTAVEGGDFEEGVRRINRILAVRGQVVPVSSQPLTLHAELADGTVVDGQSSIMAVDGIKRLWLTPKDVPASTDALRAIAEADLIVIGPGSLFTSLLPSLLMPEIREALRETAAPIVYVCNVATQAGETAGFDLAAHVEALVAHTAPGIVDIVLANNKFDARTPTGWRAEHVGLRWPPAVQPVPRLVLDDVVDPGNAHHHDPARLADAVLRAYERDSGGRRRTVGRTA